MPHTSLRRLPAAHLPLSPTSHGRLPAAHLSSPAMDVYRVVCPSCRRFEEAAAVRGEEERVARAAAKKVEARAAPRSMRAYAEERAAHHTALAKEEEARAARYKAPTKIAKCKARVALDQAAEQKAVAKVNRGDTHFYAKEEAVAAPAPAAVAGTDENANSNVSEEEVSSRAPAVVIID